MSPAIGLFGGTFDPPHIGHLIISAEADAQLILDRFYWVLTPDPPHKQGQPVTSLNHRLAMVKLAVAKNPRFELSNVEIDRPGPHYALDTVKIFADRFPNSDLVYIMGGDSLHELPTWHSPVDFVSAVKTLAVVRRPGDAIDLDSLDKIIPGLSDKVKYIKAPLLDIAAHEIRQRIATNRPFRYYLPPAVYEYILENALYRYSP
jgi:nicotinate-nucleotide adenylyltransferase